MDEQTVKRIQSDPNYIRLVAERKSFGWTLAIITLVVYYGYIALVAFAPSVIATPVAPAAPGQVQASVVTRQSGALP